MPLRTYTATAYVRMYVVHSHAVSCPFLYVAGKQSSTTVRLSCSLKVHQQRSRNRYVCTVHEAATEDHSAYVAQLCAQLFVVCSSFDLLYIANCTYPVYTYICTYVCVYVCHCQLYLATSTTLVSQRLFAMYEVISEMRCY